MEISGLVTSEGNLTPVFASGTVKSASGKITLDATKLAVKAAKGAFDKSAKMPLVIDLDFDGTEQDLKIKTARVKFHEVEVNAKGLVTLAPEQAVRIDVQSSSLPLASLADFVPMLKQYQLQGAANLFVSATGPIAKIAAKGEFGIKGGKASYPEMLKAPINFELKTAFTENSLNLSSLDITGPGSDARLVGTVVNFAMPQFKFTLSGKQIDIDQLLKLEAKKTAFVFPRLIESAEAAKNKPAKSEAKPAQASPATGVNPMAEMAKNPMMLGMAGQFNVEINKLIAKGAVIENIRAKSTLKNLVFNLESASLKTFEGLVDASANADLKSPGLGYSTKGSVKGLSSKAALTQYFPKFKDTVDGKMNANWNLAGQAFPEAIRMRSMNGTMNLNAANGRIRSINVQESLAGVIEKVPFLKGKNLPKIDEGFETMRADVKLAGGVIDANPFEMVGGGKGLTIKGKSKIQESLEQETFVDVYDPNQLLPKEISNGKDVAVALRVFGPISAPKTDYEYTVTRLAKNAIKNEGQKVLQKGLQKFLGGKGGAEGGGGAGGAPASGGDAVKDALKKIKLF
jgi:hypothetical protein